MNVQNASKDLKIKKSLLLNNGKAINRMHWETAHKFYTQDLLWHIVQLSLKLFTLFFRRTYVIGR
jgi:hypothetical protein